jgi:hypothetical protein
MDVQNTPDPASTKRRRTWPAIVIGTGVLGAATLTLTLLSPLGTSSAGASELTAFDDCDALARHMSGLAMDRILDSRRAYDDYSRGGGDEANVGQADGGDRAVPPMPPMLEPQAGAPVGGTTTTDTAASADAGTTGTAAAAPAATAGKAASDGSEAVGNDASGTNTQEAGVDEADLAKTDGRLLVTARDRRLVVMDVSGDRPKARGSVVLPGQRALELLLAGDRAIVIGTADSRERYLDDERSTGGRSNSELTTLTCPTRTGPASSAARRSPRGTSRLG